MQDFQFFPILIKQNQGTLFICLVKWKKDNETHHDFEHQPNCLT